jgi:Fic family protein
LAAQRAAGPDHRPRARVLLRRHGGSIGIDIDALRDSPVGRLVPIAGTHLTTGEPYAHWAFVPDPLPQTLELTPATWSDVDRADAALARLAASARELDAPLQLQSVLEGRYPALVGSLHSGSPVQPDVREALNQEAAFDEAFAAGRAEPLSPALLGRLNQLLVHGVSDDASPGVRRGQVTLGRPGTPIAQARFVPSPPGPQLALDFARLVHWAAAPPETIPPVVRAAMAYYQLVTLHPFDDGNGRLALLLVVLQLLHDGVLGEPWLVIDPWFRARRVESRAKLEELNRRGDWNPWVRFFAGALAECADLTRKRIEGLRAWRDAAQGAAARAQLSGLAAGLVDELICAPVLSAPMVAGAHRVSRQTALRALRRLVDVGLLSESCAGRGLLFAADAVLELVSDGTPQEAEPHGVPRAGAFPCDGAQIAPPA